MAFRGWPVEALEFYEGLEADNTKSYWLRNKAVYDEKVLGPMRGARRRARAGLGRGQDLPAVP